MNLAGLSDYPLLVETCLKLYSELYGFEHGAENNKQILSMFGLANAAEKTGLNYHHHHHHNDLSNENTATISNYEGRRSNVD